MHFARNAVLCALLAAALPGTAVLASDTYHLKREIPVPGAASSWDYFANDGKHLFLGHRALGLQAFDLAKDFAMTTIDNTKGSNGVTLAADLTLGISFNGDGTLTAFSLDDLKSVKQIKVSDDLDSARYDPVTKRIAVFGIDSEDKKGSDVVIYQLPGLDKVGVIKVASSGLEGSVADGAGGIFVNAQDQDAVYRLDMQALTVSAPWPTTGCTQPTGIAFDSADKRLFIGCRGHLTAPVLVAMNAETGAVVFSTPIGAGNDAVGYDANGKRVFATNGIGANLVIVAQDGPDSYKLDEVIGTRANDRTMAIDPNTGDVFTGAAEGIFDTSKKNLTRVSPFYPNTFSKDSFRILEYGK